LTITQRTNPLPVAPRLTGRFSNTLLSHVALPASFTLCIYGPERGKIGGTYVLSPKSVSLEAIPNPQCCSMLS
jgi:hypothetical protein